MTLEKKSEKGWSLVEAANWVCLVLFVFYSVAEILNI